MHLDEERIQRLLHGELPQREEASARDHRERCGDCRRRVDDARREEAEVHALLGHVDRPAPPVGAAEIARRARRRDAGWLRWAAGIGFVIALGGVVYAGPVAIVRDWLSTVLIRPDRAERTLPAPDRAQGREPAMAGIAVAPGDDFVILFTSADSGGALRVSLVDEAEILVRGPSGAATYTSDPTRLVVDNRGPRADFDVRLPRAAPRIEIRVAGRRVFLKTGSQVDAGAPAAAPDSYVLPLAP